MKLSTNDITILAHSLREHRAENKDDKEYVKILDDLHDRLAAEGRRLHNKLLVKAGIANWDNWYKEKEAK